MQLLGKLSDKRIVTKKHFFHNIPTFANEWVPRLPKIETLSENRLCRLDAHGSLECRRQNADCGNCAGAFFR